MFMSSILCMTNASLSFVPIKNFALLQLQFMICLVALYSNSEQVIFESVSNVVSIVFMHIHHQFDKIF